MEFKQGQTVIFEADPYGEGKLNEYEGYITYVGEGFVDVCYLYGYKSLNDIIKIENIVAIADLIGNLIPNPYYIKKH